MVQQLGPKASKTSPCYGSSWHYTLALATRYHQACWLLCPRPRSKTSKPAADTSRWTYLLASTRHVRDFSELELSPKSGASPFWLHKRMENWLRNSNQEVERGKQQFLYLLASLHRLQNHYLSLHQHKCYVTAHACVSLVTHASFLTLGQCAGHASLFQLDVALLEKIH